MRLKHMVTIYEAWFNLYRQLEGNEVRKWRYPGGKSSLVLVSTRFGHEMIVTLAVHINGH